MTAKRISRVEMSVRKPIRGAEKGIISRSNSTGLQMKLLDLTDVVRMLPSSRGGVSVNGILAVIFQTIYSTELVFVVKRCFMYELAGCVE